MFNKYCYFYSAFFFDVLIFVVIGLMAVGICLNDPTTEQLELLAREFIFSIDFTILLAVIIGVLFLSLLVWLFFVLTDMLIDFCHLLYISRGRTYRVYEPR